jgi:hypothetical protein
VAGVFQQILKAFLVLNIGKTLNKLIKADKANTVEYYVYGYQGNRVRSVVEFNNQVQNQRDYLPSLDISSHSRLPILFKPNRLPLVSKSVADCWVSVPRLLFGWMAMVCCQALLFSIFLYLKPKMPLISAEKPLPPRGDMQDCFTPDSRLSRIRRQTNRCAKYWQALKKICRYHYDQQNYDKILGNFRQFDKSLLLFAC